MANNFLITGYWGEPHVTAENDRGINAAMFGAGRFVLPVGNRFRAEYIGNNTIRMYDGKLMDNGAAAGIPAGEYVDLLIPEAGQGKNRNDLIVFQYEQDSSTLIERGTFVVVKGEETTGTAADPTLTQEDILSGSAKKDQMALWRVSVSGATIAAPVQVFSVFVPKVEAGGTGATDAAKARENLGITPANIGAAPAGFGLGETGVYLNDFNAMVGSGFYYTDANTKNRMQFCPDIGAVLVVNGNKVGRQYKLLLGKNYDVGLLCIYYTNDYGSTWTVEWINPPMVDGVEYRTTERCAGKVVYAKRFDFGESANDKVMSYTSETVTPIRYSGVVGTCAVPHIFNNDPGNMYTTHFVVNGNTVRMYCGSQQAGKKSYVNIWYAKN